MHQSPDTVLEMATKAAPPVTVIGAPVFGITVPDVIQWATMVYVLLMVAHKAWHMWKEWKTGRVTPDVEDERL